MADLLIPLASGKFERYVDQGDGTFAKQVVVSGLAANQTAVQGVEDAVAPANPMAPGQNTLSTVAEAVIAANASRLYAAVTNDDAAIKVYIGFDATLTTSSGHVLKPGATMEFPGYTGAIWAIAASGTPLVTFVSW